MQRNCYQYQAPGAQHRSYLRALDRAPTPEGIPSHLPWGTGIQMTGAPPLWPLLMMGGPQHWPQDGGPGIYPCIHMYTHIYTHTPDSGPLSPAHWLALLPSWELNIIPPGLGWYATHPLNPVHPKLRSHLGPEGAGVTFSTNLRPR